MSNEGRKEWFDELATNASGRVEKFLDALKVFLQKGLRPHFLYGTREDKLGANPHLLPPLQNTYFQKYHPEKGEISVSSDSLKITELVEQLK